MVHSPSFASTALSLEVRPGVTNLGEGSSVRPGVTLLLGHSGDFAYTSQQPAGLRELTVHDYPDTLMPYCELGYNGGDHIGFGIEDFAYNVPTARRAS